MTEKINLADTLALFSDHWRPRIAAALNGQEIDRSKPLHAS
jgi:hypothetical protein